MSAPVGVLAENDLEQRCSEGGSASVNSARESKPRDPEHVMKGTGVLAENDLEQRCSEGGSAGGLVEGRGKAAKGSNSAIKDQHRKPLIF